MTRIAVSRRNLLATGACALVGAASLPGPASFSQAAYHFRTTSSFVKFCPPNALAHSKQVSSLEFTPRARSGSLRETGYGGSDWEFLRSRPHRRRRNFQMN
jgi:hypothetical protein